MLTEVRALATAWAHQLEQIAGEMYAYLAEQLPEARADPGIAGLTLASCASNVEAMISMVRHNIPASATEAPVAALEHARRMAARGGSVDSTLRFYRLGHAFFWASWSAELTETIPDRERLVIALQQTAAFFFHYIDIVSARVGAEHVAERERLLRRAAVVRADIVRTVLAGESVEAGQAERALGHTLDGNHMAFVCWSRGDSAELERVALAVAELLGTGRPLLVADGPHLLGGWVHAEGPSDHSSAAVEPLVGTKTFDLIGKAARAASGDVHVAVGSPGLGLAGFRESRLQADRARRIAELTGRRAPSLTAYPDVALVDLLSRDLPAARSFVAAQLGALTARGATPDRAREALLVVLAHQGGLAAAAHILGVHRNTVLHRVRRAEELRGRPTTEQPSELHVALVLAEVLGDVVLGDVVLGD